jgi:hypothetical protein
LCIQEFLWKPISDPIHALTNHSEDLLNGEGTLLLGGDSLEGQDVLGGIAHLAL